MPSRKIHGIGELKALAGKEIGSSDWIEIDQERIDAFANATGDHQWIHVDPARARRESPFGATIAHGYLTLSLLPMLAARSFCVEGSFAMTVNYGANRIRFAHPVQAGARVRSRTTLLDVSSVPQGWLARMNVTVEIEGAAKPALVAETLTLYVERQQA